MRHNLSIINFLIVVLSLFLTHCKKNDQAPDNSTPTPITKTDSTINKNVRIIDSTKLILTSDTIMLNQGHLEYTIINTVPAINVNDIIVGATHGGYIKRVSSINQQQNKLVIESSQGTMEDVFNNANFNFKTNMDSLKQARIMTGYQFDVSGKTLYSDGSSSIILQKGIINIDGNWNFGFSFKNAHLDSFELSNKSASFDGQFDVNVTSSKALNVSDEVTLGRIAKYNTYFAGEVPVVVYTEVELKGIVSASVGSTIKTTLQVTTNNKADIGLRYKNSQWVPTLSNLSTSTLTVGDKSASSNVTIKLAIVPYVSFRLYRILGPYASSGLNEIIQDNRAVLPSLDWDFYAGAWIQTKVGVRANIIGKSLLDFQKEWNTDTLFYRTPDKIEKTSGDIQTGQIGQFLSQPIKVRVLDKNGKGEAEVPVYFKVTAGGGTVESSSLMTDKDGYAQTRWKLGSQNVIQTLEATTKKVDGSLINGAPLEFAASAGPAVLATLTTTSVTSITSTTASSGGNISDDGGAPVTARGVCWSTSSNPTIANSKTINGSGNGSYLSNITGLTVSTPYFVRAYATNSVGTAYGNEISFQTAVIDTFTYTAHYLVPGTIVNNNIILKLHFNNGTITGRGLIANYPFWGVVTGSVSGTSMTLNLIYDNGVTPTCSSFIPQPPPGCPVCVLQTFPGNQQYSIKENWVITGTTDNNHSTFNATYVRVTNTAQITVNEACTFSISTSSNSGTPEKGNLTY